MCVCVRACECVCVCEHALECVRACVCVCGCVCGCEHPHHRICYFNASIPVKELAGAAVLLLEYARVFYRFTYIPITITCA